jgi:hypothetical protein
MIHNELAVIDLNTLHNMSKGAIARINLQLEVSA